MIFTKRAQIVSDANDASNFDSFGTKVNIQV